MRMNAWLGLLSSTLLAGALLGACGDSEQEPTGASGPTTTGTGAAGGTGGTGGHGHTGGGGTGGTGGTGATTGGGGSGGTGGAPECSVAGDCGPSDDCHSFTCDAGKCTDVFTAAGIKTTAQVIGDCKSSTCDGNGGIVVGDDGTDPFDDQNDCTDDVCVAGAPVNDAKSAGTGCTSNNGAFCDGEKSCVECLLPGDCVSNACGADHKCAPASCGDGVLNGAETGLDCGGPVCGDCPIGTACLVGTDCIAGVCDPGLKTCSAPTCTDSVKNAAETDVDCGGPLCGDCDPGESCGNPADCTTGVCSGVPLKCQMPTCMDGVKNGAETDMDCGGPTCADCQAGKLCSVAGDCVSSVCSGNPKTCQMPTCSDNTKNGAETATDCGGGMCPTCLIGADCNVNTDCQTGFCNGAKKCATPNCMDGAKNGMETDLDCGGPTCPDCMNGLACNAGSDCASTFCYGSPTVCQADLNSCNSLNTVDMTGQANVAISFGGFFYTPNCIKVSPGTLVTWTGAFASHPLQGGIVVNSVPMPDNSQIPFTNSGTSKAITFGSAGQFPYYCQFHVASMQGVIFVAP